MITKRQALATLRRVPDRIILATMGRDLDLEKNNACLCGWFVREKLAEIRNVGASEVLDLDENANFDGNDADSRCTMMFGGTTYSWQRVYQGVTYDEQIPVIEAAFAQRVDEAVYSTRKRARKSKRPVVSGASC